MRQADSSDQDWESDGKMHYRRLISLCWLLEAAACLDPERENSMDLRMDETTHRSSFQKRLLDQLDTSASDVSSEMQKIQRLCGRWIVYQQVKLDIPNHVIAEKADIDNETLLLLHIGLASTTLASADQWSIVAALLVDEVHEYEQVEIILYLALGYQIAEGHELRATIATVEYDIATTMSDAWYELDREAPSKALIEKQPTEEQPALYPVPREDELLSLKTRWSHLGQDRDWIPRFIERPAILDELKRILSSDNPPQYALLQGVGGMGKTTLARYIASTFSGSVLWLDATSPRAWSLIDWRSNEVFTVSTHNLITYTQQLHRVLTALASQQDPVLLVLDGVEDSTAFKHWQLLINRQCRIIVTARHWEQLPASQLNVIEIDELDPEESIALLRSYRPDLHDEHTALQEIAQVLGNYPLALRLAGGTLRFCQEDRIHDPADYLARILEVEQYQPHFSDAVSQYLPWNVIKALLICFSFLETGNTTDRLALEILNGLDYLDEDFTLEPATIEQFHFLKATKDLNALNLSVNLLVLLGILQVKYQENTSMYRVHNSLRESIGLINKQRKYASLNNDLLREHIWYSGGQASNIKRIWEQNLTGHIISNRYRIVNLLTVTQESNIYEAIDMRNDQEVIIKQARDSTCDFDYHGADCARFSRLSSLLSWLRRRDIPAPRYLNLLHHDHTSCLIMTKLYGSTLATMQQTQHLRVKDGIRAILDLCYQLDRLHQFGYVHDDIKPGNIMIQPDGIAVLIDWGAARPIFRLQEHQQVGHPRSERSSSQPRLQTMQETSLGSQQDQSLELPHEALGPEHDISGLGKILQSIVPQPSPKIAEVIKRATIYDGEQYSTVIELQHALVDASNEIDEDTRAAS